MAKSMRIDWFDGSIIEDPQPTTSQTEFKEDEAAEANANKIPKAPASTTPRKLMGFRKLLDLSQQEVPGLILRLSGGTTFWELLETKLQGDFIVLIVRIIAKLYRYLRSEESLILKELLENRFLNSRFPDTLCDYMLNLPATSIAEKKLNSYFWDDLEPFYMNVLAICSCIFDIYPEEGSTKFGYLVEASRDSILRVMCEHREQFSDVVLEKLNAFEYSRDKKPQFQQQIRPPPREIPVRETHFRNMHVLPTRDELLGKCVYPVPKNIIDQSYDTLEHYLDIQFKLYREDFLSTFREGISKYMDNPSNVENIRLYHKARIYKYIDDYFISFKHEGDISNKSLMTGSLLVLTNDFQKLFLATVLRYDKQETLFKKVKVKFYTSIPYDCAKYTYLMIESEVFFEPYHRVLRALQDIRDTMPMRRYIVDAELETRHPVYLTQKTKYIVTDEDFNEVCFTVLNPHSWPDNTKFGLNITQMEAFKMALTSEWALIHGPAGTGKSLVGLKIASTLIQNLSLYGAPMLIICYTNDALDKFLLGLLKDTNEIVRLGGQTENETMVSYSLKNLRHPSKSRYGYVYNKTRSELRKVEQKYMAAISGVHDDGIIAYEHLRPFFKINQRQCDMNEQVARQEGEDPMIFWLFGHLKEDYPIEMEERDEDPNMSDSDKVCFSENIAWKHIQDIKEQTRKCMLSTKGDLININAYSLLKLKNEHRIIKIRRRLKYYKNSYSKYMDEYIMDPKVSRTCGSLNLSEPNRWKIYFAALAAWRAKMTNDAEILALQVLAYTRKVREVDTLIDSEIVSSRRVIGATTTAAAALHHLLKLVKPSIMIVEEAAEIPEAHIVAALTDQCQHVIMIGDHKQLRPHVANERLAMLNNSDVSMFERMIRSCVRSYSLTVQHRMRTCFVELLVPTFYRKLDTHSALVNMPHMCGVKKSMFFCTHTYEEQETARGFTNEYEAKWCCGLAAYFLMLKTKLKPPLKPRDITILAAYNDQADLIKAKMAISSPLNLEKVIVSTIDNYQGKENRVVIISLVRSNRSGHIGFLNRDNRICTALTRARQGLYIIGNMAALKSTCDTWAVIYEKFNERKCYGAFLPFHCSYHPAETFHIGVENIIDRLSYYYGIEDWCKIEAKKK